MCNSYLTNLSQFLDKLLKPYIPSRFSVKDSFEFADKIKALKMPENGFFVSFDVISLFTNVPVNNTVDHILSIVDEDALPFTKDTLKSLLLLACTNVLFTFNEQLFVQHEGVCMGSILGPTMAAFAMDLIESKFHLYEGHLPTVFLRYVDDCLALFTSHEDALKFLDFLNSQHSSLQFTVEFEVDKTIDFLDTRIKHDKEIVEVEWSFKSTNSGIYTPFCSYAPFRYKTAAIRCLFYRAKRICSDHLYSKAVNQITETFLKNGFPRDLILKIKHSVEQNFQNDSFSQQDQNLKFIYWKLPYDQNGEKVLTQKIRSVNKMLNGVRLKPVYKTLKTSQLFKNKDPVPPGLASNLVYDYKCDRCPERYIGETRRHLETRMHEHLHGKPVPSEITFHNHPLKKENFKIVTLSSYPRLAETICLNFHKNRNSALMNERDSSVPLHLKL